MKALIEAKADVKVLNTKTKESPLHFAVQYRGNVYWWSWGFKICQNDLDDALILFFFQTLAEVMKLFFMLNSTEHEIFPTHKC